MIERSGGAIYYTRLAPEGADSGVHLITVSRAEGLDGKEVLLRRSDADSLGATPSAVRGIYVH